MSLEFKVHSANGAEKVAFETVDELLTCWGQGCKPDFVSGSLTTFDGSYVITPMNEEAQLSILNHYQENGVPVQYDSFIHESVVGLNRESLIEVTKSMIAGDLSEPVKTELGVMRAIRRHSGQHEMLMPAFEPNRVLLNKINQPLGSFYREGTIIFDDENSEFTFVFDLKGACDIADIQSRDFLKGEVITIWDADELGLNEDVKESRLYGDESTMNHFKSRIAEMGLTDNYDIAFDGFNNSKDMPLADLGTALFHSSPELFKNHDGSEFSISKVTKHVTMAAGSKGSSFFARMGDEIKEIQEGTFIGLNVDQQKHSVLTLAEIQRMRRVDVDLELAVPF